MSPFLPMFPRLGSAFMPSDLGRKQKGRKLQQGCSTSFWSRDYKHNWSVVKHHSKEMSVLGGLHTEQSPVLWRMSKRKDLQTTGESPVKSLSSRPMMNESCHYSMNHLLLIEFQLVFITSFLNINRRWRTSYNNNSNKKKQRSE